MKDQLTAQELYNIADKYVTTNFNYIQLSVLEKMSDNMLFEHIDQIDSDDEEAHENYPMWNTCFEFRHEPNEDGIKAATDAGFGIIRDVEGFNTLLFVSGCGYSFYGAHWIPLVIELNMFGDTKERSKGVKYDMM